MDVEEILDILGNESRRRILRLLSQRPCYVTEIAYCLKMAPKVVIEHLEKLEKAGIVKSFEEGKRRYYYIDKSLRLEVTLTPHRFKAKLVNNVSKDFEKVFGELKSLERCKNDRLGEVLLRMERVQEMLSSIQCYVNSKMNEIFNELISFVEKFTNDEVERLVLYGVAKGLREFEIAEYFGLRYAEVESALKKLESRGLVERVVENGKTVWRFRGDVYVG